MARGVRATSSIAPAAPELPKVWFQKVDDELTSPTTGVDDRQARSYGYNDFSDFTRPEHYIRHIEPLEADLARQVEYDMDEQDKEWLDSLNAERRKDQVGQISYETFEIIMDRLEKEWFDLTKNIPKPEFAMPSEDSTCAICDDSEGENANAIVFCDGCNLAVHQDCYGVPYIPEGQWLCRKCTVSPENPVECILCPNEGGAFKQTTNGEWVHLLCAMWVPETRVANETFMEPVLGIDDISKQRWKLKCSICDIRGGACIQCAKTSCFLAFHTTCARREKLLLPMKSTQAEAVTLTCYCDKHLPKEQQEIREAALAVREEEELEPDCNPSNKSARAYAKTYTPGPPLVPAIIVDRITQYISKVTVRKRQDFLLLVCKYWSLKREARRGAPLLKRLHLEPWTAVTSGGGVGESEEERSIRLEQLRHLEKDLLQLRELTALTWKRESRKLQQMEILQNVLTQAIYPHEPRLRLAFERIVGYDKHDYFKNPVNKAQVPDYFDIITRPMSWSVIDVKLERHEYWDVKEFKDDIRLVLSNATLYNKSGSLFHKAAQRIRNAAEPIMAELEGLAVKSRNNARSAAHATTGTEKNGEQEDEQKGEDGRIASSASDIGDLEPPLSLVELLLGFSRESMAELREESELVWSGDGDGGPLGEILKMELAIAKPPPPRAAPELKAAREADKTTKRKAPKLRIPPRRSTADSTSTVLAAESRVEDVSHPRATSDALENLDTVSRSRIPFDMPSVPEFRSDVDNQASFKLFNSGWILPSDQKRIRRTRTPTQSSSIVPSPPASDQSALPPPKKKIRLDRERDRTVERGMSKLSVFSTAEEDNETLKDSLYDQNNYDEPTSSGNASGSGAQPQSSGRATSAPRSTRSDTTGLRMLFAVAAAAAADGEDGDTVSTNGNMDMPNEQLDVPMDVDGLTSAFRDLDTPPIPTSWSLRTPGPLIEPSGLPRLGDVIRDRNGRVIIEELDSPVTRREKHMRRKLEKEKEKGRVKLVGTGSGDFTPGLAPAVGTPLPEVELKSESTLEFIPAVTVNVEAEGKGKEKADERLSGEPELSELSSGGAKELQKEAAEVLLPLPHADSPPTESVGTRATRKSAAASPSIATTSATFSSSLALTVSPVKASPTPGTEALKKTSLEFKPGERLEGGTLVWAKADTYPWWPAVVFEIDDPTVPKAAKKMYENLKKRAEKKNVDSNVHFVRFYDKQQSWQCLSLEKLLPLGDDDELDADLVASQSKRQKWKSGKIKAECREAWRKAKQEMDTPADDGNNP